MLLSDIWALPKILRTRYSHHILNVEDRAVSGCAPLCNMITERRWRFFGHMARRSSPCTCCLLVNCKPPLSASEVTTLWRNSNMFIIYYYYYFDWKRPQEHPTTRDSRLIESALRAPIRDLPQPPERPSKLSGLAHPPAKVGWTCPPSPRSTPWRRPWPYGYA